MIVLWSTSPAMFGFCILLIDPHEAELFTDKGKLLCSEGKDRMAIIPGRNPQALIAYYLAILSLFPLAGFFLTAPGLNPQIVIPYYLRLLILLIGFLIGVSAVILGVRGIAAEKKDPEVEGAGHALVGLIMGALFGFVNFLLLAIFLSHMIGF